MPTLIISHFLDAQCFAVSKDSHTAQNPGRRVSLPVRSLISKCFWTVDWTGCGGGKRGGPGLQGPRKPRRPSWPREEGVSLRKRSTELDSYGVGNLVQRWDGKRLGKPQSRQREEPVQIQRRRGDNGHVLLGGVPGVCRVTGADGEGDGPDHGRSSCSGR